MAFRQSGTFGHGGGTPRLRTEVVGEWGGRWTFDPSKPIHRGGFGSVYEGRSESDEAVAVKVVPAVQGDGRLTERLLRREVEIAERLRSVDSANITPVLDVGRVGDDVTIVMPLADGSLADRVGILPLPDIVGALRGVATGLRDSHQADVIHRDLKPGNVLRFGGSWKLSDFGIARDATLGTQSTTFAGAGTGPYMAPELWRPPYSPSIKSDLYALGILAFELLVGSRPFVGPEESDFMRQHEGEEPPTLPEDVPGLLRGLTSRLLHKDPAQRPQDAEAVLERLGLIGEPLSAVERELQEAVAEHDRERTQLSADAMARRRRAFEEEQKRGQALADLAEIMQDAGEQLGKALPDASFELNSGLKWSCWMGTEDVGLRFAVWSPFTELPEGDGLVLAGEVVANSRRFPDERTMANIVAESSAEGRLLWNIYRFEAQGHVRRYDYGPRDRAHGLLQERFRADRSFMLRHVTHVWRLDVRPLSQDLVLELFREVLRMR